jgi:hypothetical protein
MLIKVLLTGSETRKQHETILESWPLRERPPLGNTSNGQAKISRSTLPLTSVRR